LILIKEYLKKNLIIVFILLLLRVFNRKYKVFSDTPYHAVRNYSYFLWNNYYILVHNKLSNYYILHSLN